MNTKDKILEGAKSYLLKHGQVGFTVRSVATEAGVNQGLVHHYFGSKENLVLELIDSVVTKPFAIAKELIAGQPKSEIRNVILNVLLRNNELINLLIEFIYFAQHSPAIKSKIKLVMQERREYFANALGIKDESDKYAFNAGLFGIILVNRIDEKNDIETSISKLFERFELIG
jgi:AcrR family transcriptional regulator